MAKYILLFIIFILFSCTHTIDQPKYIIQSLEKAQYTVQDKEDYHQIEPVVFLGFPK